MEAARSIEEMSGSELLDHVDDLATAQRRCELQILRAAVQHAVINNPDTLDPQLAQLPGRERARRFGGVGTEAVAEFASAELGARLGVSSWSAHSLMADAFDLVIRLPLLWARVEALEVEASYARYVARRTRDLAIEQAGQVDERVVESADGRIPWSRFEELVAGAIVAADRWSAMRREDEAAKRQFAKPTRSTENGMRGFFIRAPFAVIARFDATVQHIADVLAAQGDTDDNDHRRVKAIVILSNPVAAVELLANHRQDSSQDVDWSKLLPAVTILVHMYLGTAEAPSEGVARVEGVGPVTDAFVARHLARAATVTVQPVLDLAGQAPVDSYEIPDVHRWAVHVMCPADVFPFAPNTSRDKQIDHTVPYQHSPPGAGQSRIGNYGPMTFFHHRVKTHGSWQVRQPYPGIYIWRDPYGVYYLVDHTGTRRLRTAA
ncbi:DUF222 domain-containing protein [Nocardioides sp.]|uniref:DUF222 domain-containing protein n=1 Tax=Nocardioides sp. TaxID=35761 RepID=UPI002ED24904